MSEIYRKFGTSLRLERRGDSLATVSSTEHGEATISNGVFRAQTLNTSAEEDEVEWNLDPLHTRIEAAIDGSLTIERATLVEGLAFHSWTNGEDERRWNESTARAHVTVTDPARRIRTTCSLGAARSDAIDLAPLRSLTDALSALAGEPPPDGPCVIQLEPLVTAELLPLLLHATEKFGGHAMVRQGSHQDFPVDGTGTSVKEAALFDGEAAVTLPNVFRPSYRNRPVRAPFHLQLVEVEKSEVIADVKAVGVISPFSVHQRRLEGTLLWTRIDRTGSFAAVVSIAHEDWLDCLAVDDSRQWFPVGAGSWGQRLLLRGVRLLPVRD